MNTILIIYLVFLVAPISNFLHELGHMLGAKIVKADNITLYLGRGKEIINFRYRKLNFHIGKFFFTSGYTVSERQLEYKSSEIVLISFLGPCFNAILVFIIYFLFQHNMSEYVFLLMLYNGWLFLMNVIPFRVREQKSDGYIIVRELLKNVYK